MLNENERACLKPSDREKCRKYLQQKIKGLSEKISWEIAHIAAMRKLKKDLQEVLANAKMFEKYYRSTEWQEI